MQQVPDSVSAVHNATIPTRDVESISEAGQEGKIRKIVVGNDVSESTVRVFLNCSYSYNSFNRNCVLRKLVILLDNLVN